MDKDLRPFGQTLRQPRKKVGLAQGNLAEKLNLLHAKGASVAELKVDGNCISKWERVLLSNYSP